MTFLQSQIAKPVLSLDGSKIVGRIKNVYLTENFSNIAYFGIEDVSMQKEQTLPFEDVLDFADVAVVQNTARLQDISDVDFTSLCQVRIGMPCYTQNGILKGFVEKAAFSASGKISYFATQTDKFSPSGILSIGDVIVLKNGKTRKAKPQTMPRPKAQTTVTILQDENIADNKTDNLSAQNEKLCGKSRSFARQNGHRLVISICFFEQLNDCRVIRSARDFNIPGRAEIHKRRIRANRRLARDHPLSREFNTRG